MMHVLAVCSVFVIFVLPTQTKYLGGTISWREFEGSIRFVYRMTWEKGTGPCGPSCSLADLMSKRPLPQSLNSMSWKCTSGCPGSPLLGDVNYILTSVSHDFPGWEQGEDQFFYNLTGTGQYNISIDDLPWPNVTGYGRMVASVQLGVRNDTNVSNASPIAAVPPTVGIPFGCKNVISLPVEDPDADTIRCRLAKVVECAGACTDLPQFLMNEENCTLTLHTTTANGYTPNTLYRVTVMVEDFPDYTVSVGSEIRNPRQCISKIPLQFAVSVISSSGGCDDLVMKFTSPDIPDGIRFPYPPTGPLFQTLSYYIKTPNISDTDFLVSLAAMFNHSKIPDDKNRTNVTHLYGSWYSRQDQSGDSFNCVWGRRLDGLTTTEKRCMLVYLNDIDHCSGGAFCKRNGTCITLYKRYTCKCPHGFKPPDCQLRVSCLDFPCKHNGTCVDTGTMYKCTCAPGYNGVDCQWKYDECSSSPCQNNGTCGNDVTGFTCSCLANYTGDTCQTHATSMDLRPMVGSLDPPVWPLLVGVFGGLALAVSAGACCWWYLGAAKRRRRKKEQKVEPASRWVEDPRSCSRASSGIVSREKSDDVIGTPDFPVTSHNGGITGSNISDNGKQT
ncbi:Neurogenic locus Notch protein [Mizuhopecten yessoensis]|uniref:Neurogenic locus Notch protein n=3 Tax=Mizuhopecten yessoensis TaxID=6573 RepID=A0A210QFA2_MIZYE|nr:Neurogenic locus Notch protein [Mizuhopecten yessoensis]